MTGWKSTVNMVFGVVKSGIGATALVTTCATAGYVLYKDTIRHKRMHASFRKGAILAPLKENDFEVEYFRRSAMEKDIREILHPSFTNQYYLIMGEVGTGKTRTLIETVRALIEDSGQKGHGAPIYVMASQGKSLPDTLAEAVNFYYDEHISFKFFIDFLFQIHSLPGRDEHNKLARLLDAIEKAAFSYMMKEGRPVVLVLDGVNALSPKMLHTIQEKAKLWADTNIVKLIFVSNDETTEGLLQESSTYWSRLAAPFQVRDLDHDEAIKFLTKEAFSENETSLSSFRMIDEETAEDIYNLLGGRVHYLINFKREWRSGMQFDTIAGKFKYKEREKFLRLPKTQDIKSAFKIIYEMSKHIHTSECKRSCPDGQGILLHKLIEETSESAVQELTKCNIVKFERSSAGICVTFESPLTFNVMSDFGLAGKAD